LRIVLLPCGHQRPRLPPAPVALAALEPAPGLAQECIVQLARQIKADAQNARLLGRWDQLEFMDKAWAIIAAGHDQYSSWADHIFS
jgi:hypothetical protein